MKKIISMLLILCICCVVTFADEIYGKAKKADYFVWTSGYYGNIYEFWNMGNSAWIFCRDKNEDKFTLHWYVVDLNRKYDSSTKTGTLTLSNPSILGLTYDGLDQFNPDGVNALTGFFSVPSNGTKVFFYRIIKGKNDTKYLCFVPCNNSANCNYDLYTAYDMDRVFDSATDKLYIDLGDREYSSWLY